MSELVEVPKATLPFLLVPIVLDGNAYSYNNYNGGFPSWSMGTRKQQKRYICQS